MWGNTFNKERLLSHKSNIYLDSGQQSYYLLILFGGIFYWYILTVITKFCHQDKLFYTFQYRNLIKWLLFKHGLYNSIMRGKVFFISDYISWLNVIWLLIYVKLNLQKWNFLKFNTFYHFVYCYIFWCILFIMLW